MGLLNNIIENDSSNMNQIIISDKVLIATEKKFKELLAVTDRDYMLKAEAIFNEYMARVASIAYLQGLKDFNELFIELRADTLVILDDYEKSV